VGWVVVGEAIQLHDALGVGSLVKRDPEAVLVDLDPEVGEGPKVVHVEGGLHLCLECLDLFLLGTGDHKVVDIDAYQ
jgi:hypothetical protein